MSLWGSACLSILDIAEDGPPPLTISGVPGLPRWTGGGLSTPWQRTTVTYLPPSSSLAISVGRELAGLACFAVAVRACAVARLACAAGWPATERGAAMAGPMVAAAIVAAAAVASVAATAVTRFIVFPPVEMRLRDERVKRWSRAS